MVASIPVALVILGLVTFTGCQTEQHPRTFNATVVGIKDGDTFAVLANGTEETIRLADIDCPERSQPFGKAAKALASDLCFGKEVVVLTDGQGDRYGRLIGTVQLKDGSSVNAELVEAGLAWHFVKYSDDTVFAALERAARQARVGLWIDSTAIPPWDWRKRKRP